MESVFEQLRLDSDIFGFPTGRISDNSLTIEKLEYVFSQAAAANIRLLYWTVPSNHPEIGSLVEKAHSAGDFVQGKLIYCVEANSSLVSSIRAQLKENISIHEFDGDAPTPELLSMAIQAGLWSRFNCDKNISSAHFHMMYESWITNSVGKRAADVVLVACIGERLCQKFAGMVTVRSQHGKATIVLISVDSACRRRGVGKALMASAFEWALDRGFHSLTVATQVENLPARQLYETCGFVASETLQDFHFWIAQKAFRDPVESEIPNCKPFIVGKELDNVSSLFASRMVHTHFAYGPANERRLENEFGAKKALLVGSGTQALEICSYCVGAGPGTEIIMPSYTFVSTANAFVTHGATPVFVDIRPDTQNIDETLIEGAITDRTRAICVVHYAGVACEMDAIMEIAKRNHLYVVEDNAHGIFGEYKGRKLGTIGDIGALSFHYTKNIICGEGGAVLINDVSMIPTAMVAWEKGTNRFDFLQGRVDKYAWVGKGGSFVLSEIASAVLAAQLEARSTIIEARVRIWDKYHKAFENLEKHGKLVRPTVPPGCLHNGHIYYIRVKDSDEFSALGKLAKARKVGMFTHYEPLHSSSGGKLFAKVPMDCPETTACAKSLYRMPLWVGLTDEDIKRVISTVYDGLLESSDSIAS